MPLLLLNGSRSVTTHSWAFNAPILVTNAICNGNFGYLGHDCFSSGVHELETPFVVWLFKIVLCSKPVAIRHSVRTRIKKQGREKGSKVGAERNKVCTL